MVRFAVMVVAATVFLFSAADAAPDTAFVPKAKTTPTAITVAQANLPVEKKTAPVQTRTATAKPKQNQPAAVQVVVSKSNGKALVDSIYQIMLREVESFSGDDVAKLFRVEISTGVLSISGKVPTTSLNLTDAAASFNQNNTGLQTYKKITVVSTHVKTEDGDTWVNRIREASWKYSIGGMTKINMSLSSPGSNAPIVLPKTTGENR